MSAALHYSIDLNSGPRGLIPAAGTIGANTANPRRSRFAGLPEYLATLTQMDNSSRHCWPPTLTSLFRLGFTLVIIRNWCWECYGKMALLFAPIVRPMAKPRICGIYRVGGAKDPRRWVPGALSWAIAILDVLALTCAPLVRNFGRPVLENPSRLARAQHARRDSARVTGAFRVAAASLLRRTARVTQRRS